MHSIYLENYCVPLAIMTWECKWSRNSMKRNKEACGPHSHVPVGVIVIAFSIRDERTRATVLGETNRLIASQQTNASLRDAEGCTADRRLGAAPFIQGTRVRATKILSPEREWPLAGRENRARSSKPLFNPLPLFVVIDVARTWTYTLDLVYIQQFVWIGYYDFAWILEDEVHTSISAFQSCTFSEFIFKRQFV